MLARGISFALIAIALIPDALGLDVQVVEPAWIVTSDDRARIVRMGSGAAVGGVVFTSLHVIKSAMDEKRADPEAGKLFTAVTFYGDRRLCVVESKEFRCENRICTLSTSSCSWIVRPEWSKVVFVPSAPGHDAFQVDVSGVPRFWGAFELILLVADDFVEKYHVHPGVSGSALVAERDGRWSIIGLVRASAKVGKETYIVFDYVSMN